MNNCFSSIVSFCFVLLFVSCGSYSFNEYTENNTPEYTPPSKLNRKKGYNINNNVRIASSLHAPDYTSGMPEGDGCWARCLIEDIYSLHYEVVYKYTGDPEMDSLYNEIEIEVEPAETNWVKKTADPPCASSYPDDCLVWCLVESDPVVNYYREVKDTTLTSEFRKIEVGVKTLTQKGGYTEWKQVVCAADQDSAFYSKIQEALINKGYFIPEMTEGVFSKTSKDILVKYQKDYGLPVGNLDFETMESLDIQY